VFEKRLLEVLGYGIDLASAAHGARIETGRYYQFRAGQGLCPARPEEPAALAGASLLGLAQERFADARALEDARRLLQAALAACLEGRPLATRAVARSMLRRAAR